MGLRALNLDGSVKVLSRICRQQKECLDGLRIYQVDREHKNLSRWIEEAIENVSTKNPEI